MCRWHAAGLLNPRADFGREAPAGTQELVAEADSVGDDQNHIGAAVANGQSTGIE